MVPEKAYIDAWRKDCVGIATTHLDQIELHALNTRAKERTGNQNES
jgi:hypothetical protein